MSAPGNARAAWTVYRKELLETLRDRRTLIVMVLLPLTLYPLVGVGVAQWLGAQRAERERHPSRVALVGPAWPELARAVEQHDHLVRRRLDPGADPAQAVRDGEIDAAVELPEGVRARIAAGEGVTVSLVFDETRDASLVARRRLGDVVRKLADRLLAARLAREGLPPGLAHPLRARERPLATGAQRGRRLLSGLLPMLLVLMVLLGAFYPAIDLTAGEKERGTLETLLTTPVPRIAVVLGKYAVVVTIALATGLLNLGSLALTLGLGFGPALARAGVALEIPWGAAALTVVALVPAAAFFGALMLAVASLARSFKEAQNLLTPIYVVCVLPAMLAQLPGVSLDALTALLPAVNVALLARALIGGSPSAGPVALALLSTLLYAALSLRLAARVFSSERLLFAPEGRRDPRAPRRGVPEPGGVALLLLGVMALLILVGRPVQSRSLIGGLLVTEWLLIALPVLLYVRLGRYRAADALSLRPPTGRAVAGALLLGASTWFLVGVVVENVQQRFLPMPREMVEEARRIIFSGDRPLALDLFALAVSPAICEELLFRGLLLSATRRVLPAGAAILLNGVAFGLFHLSIYRFLPTALLGLMLAAIVVRTGSIWPAMLFHVVNNAAAVIIAQATGGYGPSLGTWSTVFAAIAALAVASAGVALLGGLRRGPAGSPRPPG